MFFLSHKFAPTPPLPDLSRFENDLQSFFNKLRARVVFEKLQYKPTSKDGRASALERTLITKTSTQQFQSCQNSSVEAFISCIRAEVDMFKPKRKFVSPDNMSKNVRAALRDIRSWKDIIIRPFDKGVGFFLMYEEEYLRRVGQHLDNRETYPSELTSEVIEKIRTWTEKYNKEIGMTKKIIDWVIPNEESNNPGNIYTLT